MEVFAESRSAEGEPWVPHVLLKLAAQK